MKEETLKKTMDKTSKILDDAGICQYVLSVSGYKDSAEIVKEPERDPESVILETQIRADEEMLFAMIVTMLETLIKNTTEPRSYGPKINLVVANINMALRELLLD